MTHKNPIIALFLYEMYVINTQIGPQSYKLTPSQPKQTTEISVSSVFTYTQRPFAEISNKKFDAEKLLQNSLRFCDKDSYLDSISIDPDLSTSEFLEILNKITENKAFTVPCRVS
jgi:hypothetical protein